MRSERVLRQACAAPAFALLALLPLGGCSTASRAAGGAATASATAITRTTSTARDLFAWILPAPSAGPERQRELMREQAGTSHFRNEGFTEGRDELHVQHTEFEQHRGEFISPEFVASRDRFRRGDTRPLHGPVLGPLAGNPDLARALILASAAQGAGVVPTQPVLARLLPAFGN